jgi:hypothetical protein
MWVTDDVRVRKHAKTTEITSFCQITYIKICIFCRTSISIFFYNEADCITYNYFRITGQIIFDTSLISVRNL